MIEHFITAALKNRWPELQIVGEEKVSGSEETTEAELLDIPIESMIDDIVNVHHSQLALPEIEFPRVPIGELTVFVGRINYCLF